MIAFIAAISFGAWIVNGTGVGERQVRQPSFRRHASEGDAVGRELCSNLKVRKISFTGSTEVGRLLMRQCSEQIKKVALELGGNAPFIVFDDADIDAAVDVC